MARRRKAKRTIRRYYGKFRRRTRGMTIPLAAVGGVASGLFSPALGHDPLGKFMSGDIRGGVIDLAQKVTGTDNDGFRYDVLLRTYTPIVLGLLIHKVVGGKLGLNSMLAKAGVPILRI